MKTDLSEMWETLKTAAKQVFKLQEQERLR